GVRGLEASRIEIDRGGKSYTADTVAGREADIVGLNPRLTEGHVGPQSIASLAPELYDERLGWVREGARERFDAIEIQSLTFLVRVVSDAGRVLEETAQMFGMAPEEAADVPIALIGSVDQIADSLESRRRRWGMSYWVVHDNDVDDFAPVVARLSGA
ncbi:MAG TPA: LLM class F420-dependent oxidoreductase, partial [Acidimicrobiales bacterium]|nr:LLM class F420-dependent oxidoreductase [Acidimicrobiales bacterium]